MKTNQSIHYVSTRNPCRLCTPFGACLAFSGVAGCAPFIHGSQGCSTYIRRYLIGHFREPVDIACSNFGEATTIFGGQENLEIGLLNVIEQYQPKMIGIATTCLAETIGDDVKMFLHEFCKKNVNRPLPELVQVSTPSYQGSDGEGFHAAVHAMVEQLSQEVQKNEQVNLFLNAVSPADIRYLYEILQDFELESMILPDFSDSMDGGIWNQYERNIGDGTPVDLIKKSGGSRASIEFGVCIPEAFSASKYLHDTYGIPKWNIPSPLSLRHTDKFFEVLSRLSGKRVPEKHLKERSLLLDSYVDGHKYIFEKRAVVYGQEDLVVSISSFLCEIGIVPVLCATGGTSGKLKAALGECIPEHANQMNVLENVDFMDIEEACTHVKPDILIGNSNGYKIAKHLNVPLVRVGLPIHDRLGAARVRHVGYRGAQQLYDRIVNTFLEIQQESTPIGYTHL